MKIGDEVYVHGYVDEIRSDVVIIRNDGGYFGTVPSEVNCSEIPNSCEDEPRTGYCNDCKRFRDKQVCGRCRSKNLYAPKDEPQPRCPKCGKRGYIRSLESMGVKLKHFDEYKWKCTNCNRYFKEEPKTEPQTDWKDQMWTEAIETEKTEPQTDVVALDKATLMDYLINSVDENDEPVWTERHIDEILKDFDVVPKTEPQTERSE